MFLGKGVSLLRYFIQVAWNLENLENLENLGVAPRDGPKGWPYVDPPRIGGAVEGGKEVDQDDDRHGSLD